MDKLTSRSNDVVTTIDTGRYLCETFLPLLVHFYSTTCFVIVIIPLLTVGVTTSGGVGCLYYWKLTDVVSHQLLVTCLANSLSVCLSRLHAYLSSCLIVHVFVLFLHEGGIIDHQVILA